MLLPSSRARSPSAAAAVLCCCWALLLASRPTAVEGFAVLPGGGLSGTRYSHCAAMGADPVRTASCLFFMGGGGAEGDGKTKEARRRAMKFLRGGSKHGYFQQDSGSGSSEDITTQVPDSIIGPTLSVQGTVEFQELLRIDGHFEGEVVGDGSLIIGPTAEVISDLSGLNEVYVEGILIGDCSCNKMQIRGAGCVTGNLMTGSLGMDPSVVLKGSANVDKLRSRNTASPSKKDDSSSDSKGKGDGGDKGDKAKAKDESSSPKKKAEGGGGWAPPPMSASTTSGAAAKSATAVHAHSPPGGRGRPEPGAGGQKWGSSFSLSGEDMMLRPPAVRSFRRVGISRVPSPPPRGSFHP